MINYYSRCAILASDKMNKSVQALHKIKILTAVPILAPELVGHPLQLTLAGTACQPQNMGAPWNGSDTMEDIFERTVGQQYAHINLARWP